MSITEITYPKEINHCLRMGAKQTDLKARCDIKQVGRQIDRQIEREREREREREKRYYIYIYYIYRWRENRCIYTFLVKYICNEKPYDSVNKKKTYTGSDIDHCITGSDPDTKKIQVQSMSKQTERPRQSIARYATDSNAPILVNIFSRWLRSVNK